MIMLLQLIVVAFFVTYLITEANLFDEMRGAFVVFITTKDEQKVYRGWRVKLAYLATCPKCMGVWVSLILYCWYVRLFPWSLSYTDFMNFLFVAGGQLLLVKFTERLK